MGLVASTLGGASRRQHILVLNATRDSRPRKPIDTYVVLLIRTDSQTREAAGPSEESPESEHDSVS